MYPNGERHSPVVVPFCYRNTVEIDLSNNKVRNQNSEYI